jgi:catechol 2,3-dioxygenase-like lactoylglutathione lyase family enzyme
LSPKAFKDALSIEPSGLSAGGDRGLHGLGLLGHPQQSTGTLHQTCRRLGHKLNAFVGGRRRHGRPNPIAIVDQNIEFVVPADRSVKASLQQIRLCRETHVQGSSCYIRGVGDGSERCRRVAVGDEQAPSRLDESGFGVGSASDAAIPLDEVSHIVQSNCMSTVRLQQHADAPPRLDGIHHLKLPVSDLDQSQAWYEDRFGYEGMIDFVEDGVRMGVSMRHPNGGPDLALRCNPGKAADAAGFDYFAIGVPGHDAIDALAARLTERGDPHDGVHRTPVGWVLLGLRDPDGHHIRFYTVPLEFPPGFSDHATSSTSPVVKRGSP